MDEPKDIKLSDPALTHEIMSKIRGKHYQHPGEEEAIELVFANISKNNQQKLLDVGCGCGETAAYIHKHGWGKVTGIDINPDLVAIANKSHLSRSSNPKFFACDVMQIDQLSASKFKKQAPFDIIYSFSALFYFPDKTLALQKLANLAHHNSTLLLFDYVDYGEYEKYIYRSDYKPPFVNSIKFEDVRSILTHAGWELKNTKQIDELFVKWYTDLVTKITTNRQELSAKYGEDVFTRFANHYQHILDIITAGYLGGIIIEASLK
jgi:SAM-dependent methyltransferase